MKKTRNATTVRPTAPRIIGLLKPVIIGSGLAILFILCLQFGIIPSQFLHRYILGHPVSLIETAMLSVGLCFLWFKFLGLRKETAAVQAWNFDLREVWNNRRDQIITSGGMLSDQGNADPSEQTLRQRAEAVAQSEATAQYSEDYQIADHLIYGLSSSKIEKSSSLYLRILSALDFVKSRQSAEGIDDHLKHLSVQDQEVQHESYSLVRLMIWAIPMLGFLGTVIGISEALGGLNLGSEANLSAMIGTLKSSLYVAFDTTALALCYGVILMFLQFGIDRKETRLLQDIDEIAEDEVLSTFSSASPDRDPVARSIQKMGQALLKATFSLVEHQHDLWNESLVAAQDAWITATENAKIQSDGHLKEIIDAAGEGLAIKLASALEEADSHLKHRWQQWQVSLSENTRTLAAYQENAASHLDMLHKFFDSASDLSQQQRERVDQLTERLGQWMDHSTDQQQIQSQLHQRMVQKINETNDLLSQANQISTEMPEYVTNERQWSEFLNWAKLNEENRSQTESQIAGGLNQIVESIQKFQENAGTNSVPAETQTNNEFQQGEVAQDQVALDQSAEKKSILPTETSVRSVPGKIGRSRPKKKSLTQEELIEKALLGSSENEATPVVLPFQQLMKSEATASEEPAVLISSRLASHQVFQNQDREGQIVVTDQTVSVSQNEEQVVQSEAKHLSLHTDQPSTSHSSPTDREIVEQNQESEGGSSIVNPDVSSNLVPFRDARIHRTA